MAVVSDWPETTKGRKLVNYPTRARIIDVTGVVWNGLALATPVVSNPHIGKEGLAEEVEDGVRITLDDGNIIYGYECWWEPIS